MTQAQQFVDESDFNQYGDKSLDMAALNEQATAIEEKDCTMYVHLFPDGSKIYSYCDMIYCVKS